MSAKRTHPVDAAEHVRRFLYVRSAQVGGDPDVIYTLGAPDGDMVELRVSDLTALVRSIMGGDVATVDEDAAARIAQIRRSTGALQRKAAARYGPPTGSPDDDH